ncbi:MAG: sugar O-acetyltransferase [Lachnospiraceae bacterium]|nr:sugar O-acetyltransferase [Lachnospiraceae bacterium]
MTEREKMEQGLWYDANYDKELLEEREKAEDLCFEVNHIKPSQKTKRDELLNKLLPNKAENVTILSPFYTDYGYNCFIGEETFINHNAYLMDGAKITIGKHCFIGPNCGIYTAIHATIAEERNQGLEIAKPITIGDNVWFGGDVTVLPGVTIGENCIIGAKSVVTKDIPANTIAVGNPCRVMREITEEDRIANKII